MEKPRKLSQTELDAGKSPKGGWTAKTLAGWGVSWPPPHGWKEALLKGEPLPKSDRAAAVKPPAPGEPNHKALLHQVVMALISAGQGHLLNELPDVAAYYNCRIPTVADIVGGRPPLAIITGGITYEDRVYSFQVARLVKSGQSLT